ncbi:hypothetical protein JCM11491_006365 [Sporobolomyces phaffii]
MSFSDPIQDSTPPHDSYEHVLKTFTQPFDEDSIETAQLRATPHDSNNSVALARRDDVPLDRPVHPFLETTARDAPIGGSLRALLASPARSTSSSSSGLTYIDLDPVVEAQAQAAQRTASTARPSAATTTSKHDTTFDPILPEELTSRQPTPRPSRASHATTIPSPFLAATTALVHDDALHTLSPDAAAAANRRAEFGGASAPDYRPESPRKRTDSLEPPVWNLDRTFDALRSRDDHAEEDQKGKGKEVCVPRNIVNEWTLRFLEADRKLKGRQQLSAERSTAAGGGQRGEATAWDSKAADDAPERDEAFSDPVPLDGTHASSSPTSSRLGSSPPVDSSSPVRSKSKPNKRSISKVTEKDRKRKPRASETSLADDESGSGSDRNMTTEKSVALLPNWYPGKTVRDRVRAGRVRVWSDLAEESEEGTDHEEGDTSGVEDDSDETDYDEPIGVPAKRRSKQREKLTKPSSSSTRSKPKSSRKAVAPPPEMALGDRSNRAKWREIDAYKLETELTL